MMVEPLLRSPPSALTMQSGLSFSTLYLVGLGEGEWERYRRYERVFYSLIKIGEYSDIIEYLKYLQTFNLGFIISRSHQMINTNTPNNAFVQRRHSAVCNAVYVE